MQMRYSSVRPGAEQAGTRTLILSVGGGGSLGRQSSLGTKSGGAIGRSDARTRSPRPKDGANGSRLVSKRMAAKRVRVIVARIFMAARDFQKRPETIQPPRAFLVRDPAAVRPPIIRPRRHGPELRCLI